MREHGHQRRLIRLVSTLRRNDRLTEGWRGHYGSWHIQLMLQYLRMFVLLLSSLTPGASGGLTIDNS
jgi:hypothetical protein